MGSRWKPAMKDGGGQSQKDRKEASDLGLGGRLLSPGHWSWFLFARLGRLETHLMGPRELTQI